MAKFLDQDLVTKFAQLGADIDKLQGQKEKIRQELIAGFEAGLKCPRRGPYLVKFTYQNRRQISWKDELMQLAKQELGSAWRKYMARIEKSAPTTKIPMLLPDVNPDYDVEGGE